MFRFGAYKPTTETETENFNFLKNENLQRTEPKLNQNFGNGLANFGQFFWFVSFVHTPKFCS